MEVNRGVWPVMITPFTEDNRIDYSGVERIIEWYDRNGVTGIFSTNRVAVPFKEAKTRAESDMRLTMDNLLRFMKSMGL